MSEKITILEDGTEVWEFLGNKYYYKEGELHRTDGPAVTVPGHYKKFYLDGEAADPADIFNNLSKEEKMKAAFNLDQWSE